MRRKMWMGVVAAGLAVGAVHAAPPDLDAAIRARVGVSAYTMQRLIPLAQRQGGFRLTVDLAGRTFSADLQPFAVNTPDCVMVLEDGTDHPAVVPAPALCTYRGEVSGIPGSVCSGSVIDGRVTAVVIIPGLGSWSILPLSEVAPGAEPAEHIVTSNDDVTPGPWHCGVEDDLKAEVRHGSAGSGSGVGNPADTTLLCELACEADYPFYQSVGMGSSAVAQDIATVIANVSSYYMLSGANLRFRIVRYTIRTTPQSNPGLYNVTNADTLLTNFRTVWNNLAGGIPRDTAHLFTGQHLDGNTVGLAYLSTVCMTSYAYGLSESRYTLQPGRRAALTAHEIGHNFSAQHCDSVGHICTPCWIMLATLGNTTNELTRLGCSTSIIANYAATRACIGPFSSQRVCLPDIDGDGVLTAADFTGFAALAAAGDLRADFDSDGRVTAMDFVVFQASFAAGCSE